MYVCILVLYVLVFCILRFDMLDFYIIISMVYHGLYFFFLLFCVFICPLHFCLFVFFAIRTGPRYIRLTRCLQLQGMGALC